MDLNLIQNKADLWDSLSKILVVLLNPTSRDPNVFLENAKAGRFSQ